MSGAGRSHHWGLWRHGFLGLLLIQVLEPKCFKSLCVCCHYSHVRLSVTLWTLQPARLLCLWDSPGKNAGVGCHALLQGIFQNEEIEPASLKSPASAAGFTIGTTWEALQVLKSIWMFCFSVASMWQPFPFWILCSLRTRCLSYSNQDRHSFSVNSLLMFWVTGRFLLSLGCEPVSRSLTRLPFLDVAYSRFPIQNTLLPTPTPDSAEAVPSGFPSSISFWFNSDQFK